MIEEHVETQLKKLLEKALDDAYIAGLEKGKAALLTLCQEHRAQYQEQGMTGKAEAIAVLVGEIERVS